MNVDYEQLRQLAEYIRQQQGRELTTDEIEANKRRRSDRMNELVAATRAGIPATQTLDVNGTIDS